MSAGLSWLPELQRLYGPSVRVVEDRPVSIGCRWRCWVDTAAGPIPIAYGESEEACCEAAINSAARVVPCL